MAFAVLIERAKAAAASLGRLDPERMEHLVDRLFADGEDLVEAEQGDLLYALGPDHHRATLANMAGVLFLGVHRPGVGFANAGVSDFKLLIESVDVMEIEPSEKVKVIDSDKVDDLAEDDEPDFLNKDRRIGSSKAGA